MNAAEFHAAVAAALDGAGVGLPSDFAVRRLVSGDVVALQGLRQEVLASLEDPDLYRVEGESDGGTFIADHLGTKGVCLGVFWHGDLAAYGALTVPPPGEANRGRDLPLPDEALGEVAHLASAMVSPRYRGLGLHHRLVSWRKAMAGALGRRHLFTTVSTRNHTSWGHLTDHGFRIRRLLTVGPGLRRYLLYCDLQAPLWPLSSPLPGQARICGLTDLDAVAELLALDWSGVGRVQSAAGWQVALVPPGPDAGPAAGGPTGPRPS